MKKKTNAPRKTRASNRTEVIARHPGDGAVDETARHAQGRVAPRAEPSRLGAKRHKGGRR